MISFGGNSDNLLHMMSDFYVIYDNKIQFAGSFISVSFVSYSTDTPVSMA